MSAPGSSRWAILSSGCWRRPIWPVRRLERLKLELTESLLLDNADDVVVKMAQLKAHGVALSLDDFGTGFSSLSYLKRLPLDQLKIDQSFVRDIVTDHHDAAIAKTIVALGHNLGMDAGWDQPKP